jgi:hypothetical protein
MAMLMFLSASALMLGLAAYAEEQEPNYDSIGRAAYRACTAKPDKGLTVTVMDIGRYRMVVSCSVIDGAGDSK